MSALRLVHDFADDFLKFSAKGEKKRKKKGKKRKRRGKKKRREEGKKNRNNNKGNCGKGNIYS